MTARKTAAKPVTVDAEDVVDVLVSDSDVAFFEANKPRKGRVAKPSVHQDVYNDAKVKGLGKVPSTVNQLAFNQKELLKAAAAMGDGRPTFVHNAEDNVLLFKPMAKRKRVSRS